jgi:hypothetical protein
LRDRIALLREQCFMENLGIGQGNVFVVHSSLLIAGCRLDSNRESDRQGNDKFVHNDVN